MTTQTQPIITIENKEVAQAYEDIADFFDCYGIIHARSYIKKCLTLATSEHYWKDRSPHHAIYFFEMMQKLLKAAFIIVQSGDKRSKAILQQEEEKEPDLTDVARYCGWSRNSGPWDAFPRYLTKKEYVNPYKALKKVVNNRSMEDWKKCNQLIVEFALSTGTIRSFHNEIEPLQINRLFNKLVEGCHLISVRAIDVAKGRPYPKWKGLKARQKEEPETEEETEVQETDTQS